MGGEVVIGTSLDTTKFDQQILQVERRINEIEKELSSNKETNFLSGREVADLNAELEKAKNKYISLNKQKAKLAQPTGLSTEISNVGNGLTKTVSKVGRWALAVLSVRSAYALVRQATSTLAQSNDELAGKLEGIRLFVASALEPVVMGLINLVYKLLTYVNMIAQAWFGVNLFAKSTSLSMKSGAKSAEKMRKSLAGFDEMNILSDNVSSAGGGGGASFPTPENVPVPDWMQWIIDHKAELLSVLGGIAGGLVAINLGLSPLKALGIGVAIAGILLTIQGIIDYLKDPTWNNFGKVIQGIGSAVLGIGIAFGGLPAIITGAIIIVVGTIVKYWEEIKGFLQKGIDWLTEKSSFIHDMFGDTIGNIYDMFVKNMQLVLGWFDTIFKDLKQILDGIIQLIQGVFTGDLKQAGEGIKNIFLGIGEIIYKTLDTALQMVKNKAIQIATTAGDVISSAFRAVVNGVLGAIERILNSPINAINSLIGTINSIPGINLSRLSTFRLPRLAVGGIINMPGRGVPIGGAIAGEAGREGVLPLTDAQAMETLGETIGRYITINANIVNSMNGRVISRELQQIRNQDNFAYNR